MCPHVLKTLLYFNVPTCWNLFVVLFAYRVTFFLHVPFQLHSPQFILTKCPIHLLKILHGKLELSTTINNNIISKPRGPISSIIFGVGRRSGLVGVCEHEKWKPIASSGQSSPKLTPTLSASFPTPKKGILTGTYFVRDQVPDCPVFTHAKNKLPFWDKYFNRTVTIAYQTECSMPMAIKYIYALIIHSDMVLIF